MKVSDYKLSISDQFFLLAIIVAIGIAFLFCSVESKAIEHSLGSVISDKARQIILTGPHRMAYGS